MWWYLKLLDMWSWVKSRKLFPDQEFYLWPNGSRTTRKGPRQDELSSSHAPTASINSPATWLHHLHPMQPPRPHPASRWLQSQPNWHCGSWDTQNSHRNMNNGKALLFETLSLGVVCYVMRDNTDRTSAATFPSAHLSKSTYSADLKNHQRGIECTCSSSFWAHQRDIRIIIFKNHFKRYPSFYGVRYSE